MGEQRANEPTHAGNEWRFGVGKGKEERKGGSSGRSAQPWEWGSPESHPPG